MIEIDRIAEEICNRRCGYTENHSGHNHRIYYDHIEITGEHIAEAIERYRPGGKDEGINPFVTAAKIARESVRERPFVPHFPMDAVTTVERLRTRLPERDDEATRCFIRGCDNNEIDPRGPVWLIDGSEWNACTEHGEPIFRVLGEQASWEKTDAAQVSDSAGREKP